MKNAIIIALIANGFAQSATCPTKFDKGCGSISHGKWVGIEVVGQTAKVTVETYFCDGVIEQDTHQERLCWLSNLWEHIPEWALK